MSTYFGNGYLLNLARRSAVPFNKLRRAPTHAPPPLTEFSNTSESEPLETQSETLQSTARGPLETQAAPVRLSATPTEIESGSRVNPTATQDSPQVPRTTPVANTSVSHGSGPQVRQALRPPEMSPTPARRQSTQQEQDADNLSQRSVAAVTNPPRDHNSMGESSAGARTQTFEVKMPEDFFKKSSQVTALRTDTEAKKTEIKLSSILAAPNESPAPGLSTSSHPNIPPGTQTELIVTPVHSEERLESDMHELSHTVIGGEPARMDSTKVRNADAAAQSQTIQFVPRVALRPEITTQLSAGAMELSIETKEREVVGAGSRVEPFEAPTPMPEARLSEYLEPMQPQINPPVESPSPGRLRINRMDIQIINTVAPSAPRAAAPDVGRLLDQKHLGRVALLL